MEGAHFAISEVPTARYYDKYSSIYVAFVLCGIGFLLPYNSFVTAVDYYQAKHPGTTIIYDISLTYICVACVAVFVNNALVGSVSLQARITAGYLLSLVTMTLVTICDIGLELFPEHISYRITLISVASVSVASTVQQSSFYGFASMLPSRYTQALMLGESTAGVFTSLNRVITKAVVTELSASILVFFSFCLAAIVACCVVFQIIRQTEFVELHVGLCLSEDGKAEFSAPSAVASAEEVDLKQQNERGALQLDASNVMLDSDMYSSRRELREDADLADENETIIQKERQRKKSLCHKMTVSLQRRLAVIKRVWPYMLSIALAYLVTLSLYPGVVSEVTSCRFGSWMPVMLIIVFNVADFVGKLLASSRHEMRRYQLVLFGLARFILIPMLMLCTMPRSSPKLNEEIWPIAFSILLGISNGYLGSVPIILAPKYVPNQHKELTGNMMTLFYNIGLTVGSIFAYVIESLLGPHADMSSCGLSSNTADKQSLPSTTLRP